MSTHKAIERICQIYKDNPSELNDLLREIVKNKGLSRRRRRAAYEKLREMNSFIELDSEGSVNRSCCDDETDDSDNSSVSSASSGSSENSHNKRQLCETMGLTKSSSMEEWLRFDCRLRMIKNRRKKEKTHAKKEARRRYILDKKASRKASEAKKLRDSIKKSSYNIVSNIFVLLEEVGFQRVFFHQEKTHALVSTNMNSGYKIVLFKGVSSPRKSDICNEIGQRAWQYLRFGKLNLVRDEISKFLEEKRNTGQAESETETSTFVQSLFDPDADNADDEADEAE
jgi:hypothetical protein